ncbi:hypothetical protein IC617_08040 [Neiella sp. HB171785]|uniref:Uncharacterized protein n=1 Tax=Neiella litorisoli TaxID=2771431 RepID=A0A8J6UIX3_9GAMM|nr:hypothetical protein [Neiella litorisoli]MBD1389373.1 hypothetical protein [Neiella litorisoli]
MNKFTQVLFGSVLAVLLAIGASLFVAGLTTIGIGPLSVSQLHFAVWSLVIGAVLMVAFIGGNIVMLLYSD